MRRLRKKSETRGTGGEKIYTEKRNRRNKTGKGNGKRGRKSGRWTKGKECLEGKAGRERRGREKKESR